MNPNPSPAPQRRLWLWLLALALTPCLLLGIAAASFLTLDRDAAALRRRVMATSNSEWNTTVQLSLGRFSLAAIRTGLAYIPKVDDQAKQALRAIHGASVGVYTLKGAAGTVSRRQLFAEADEAMNRRGYARMVGVCDRGDTVMIYTPTDPSGATTVDLCLAVLNGRELVIVSTSVDATVIAELGRQHSVKELKDNLHLAGL